MLCLYTATHAAAMLHSSDADALLGWPCYCIPHVVFRSLNFGVQELAERLADPLMPKFSHRFFTGGAAAAVSAQQGHNLSDQTLSPDASADARPHQGLVVQQAVQYANKVTDSRKAAAAKEASGKANGKLALSASCTKKPAPISRQAAEDQALQRALNRSSLKKDLRQRNSKLTVIPAAFGRERQGADALQALRSKLGRPAKQL